MLWWIPKSAKWIGMLCIFEHWLSGELVNWLISENLSKAQGIPFKPNPCNEDNHLVAQAGQVIQISYLGYAQVGSGTDLWVSGKWPYDTYHVKVGNLNTTSSVKGHSPEFRKRLDIAHLCHTLWETWPGDQFLVLFPYSHSHASFETILVHY